MYEIAWSMVNISYWSIFCIGYHFVFQVYLHTMIFYRFDYNFPTMIYFPVICELLLQHGITWYYMILHGITWYYVVLHGIT